MWNGGGDPAWAKYRAIGALGIATAIVGGGFASESAEVSRSKMVRTVLAWLLSFVVATTASHAAFAAFRVLV